MMKDWLSISEFGKAAGLSIKALRIYEEKGILVPSSRSESRYRVYGRGQLSQAQAILQFKQLGFSLEEIKVLLKETSDSSLQDFLERRLQESRLDLHNLKEQILSLETILTSLKLGRELSPTERNQVMENFVAESVNKLKRRGVVDQQAEVQVAHEVSLYSEPQKMMIAGLRKIFEYAKGKNILMGPGRGNSGGSLVLYSEGYSQFNPLRYGLVPEYFSHTKMFWMDVEYSHSQEIGKMCDELSARCGLEVVAFRSPFLDILKMVQDKVGQIDFDSFSDMDPMILTAPQRLGAKGLYWCEPNELFHAFVTMSAEDRAKYSHASWDLEKFYRSQPIASPMELTILDTLRDLYQRENFLGFRSRTESDCPQNLPELKYTKGLLIYMEDWDLIFSRVANVSVAEARSIRIALRKDENAHADILAKIADPLVRDLLKDKVTKVFMKAHAVTCWWFYKRSAILKSLWEKEYLEAINDWEQKHKLTWVDFGYKTQDGSLYLKA
ncbi:MerR family transcriptional regulator [Bdellovibrio sp. KM01]|uniref:MerR family transcriptional regulator n=1 Tax=Bdellovibrio sp. KM01 TaxID=2748865 RepID=UPI0015E909D1|nr:MerR family transcriptional regulator [Bdellovibrio sp. KM01]QLY24198.1 MerR family transcriptional regulator [Bdellovibrio sp. KM01]